MAASDGPNRDNKEVYVNDRDNKEVFVNDRSPSATDSGDETASSTVEHVFSDPQVADRWRKVYENAKYENRHRFDPNYTWTAEEEKRLVRKVCSAMRQVRLFANHYRSIGVLLSGHGSCSAPSTFTGATLTAPSRIIWRV